MTESREIFISVDIEASGPIPGEFSMLTIGACSVDDPSRTFTCSIKPISNNSDPAALAVTGLSLEELMRVGQPPEAAMAAFAKWLECVAADGGKLVFVGFNAPFDWAFINYYFVRFLGANPFGFAALDVKAYYMGVTGCRWDETRSSSMAARLNPASAATHNALQDAIFQAELFRLAQQLANSRDSAQIVHIS